MGEAILIMSRLEAYYLREMMSLTHPFVVLISDSADIGEVRSCEIFFQQIGPPHLVIMWPDI